MSIKKAVCLLLATLCLSLVISNKAEAAIVPERIGGSTRYDTSVLISQNGWSQSSDYAIIISGQDFEDALCAAPLARKYNAPILLAPKDKVDNQPDGNNLSKELYRLKVKKVFLIGREDYISPNIECEIEDRGIEVKKIVGKDKYDISFQVAKMVGTDNGMVLVNGESCTDAVTISSIAAAKGMPLILVPDTADSIYKNDLQVIGKDVPKVYAVGDSSLISDDIVSKLNNVDRILGDDEYERNVNILEKFKNDVNYNTVYLASEDDLADGLAGSSLAALTSSPIILIKDKYDSRIQDYLSSKLDLIGQINVLGGQGVISDLTLQSILPVSKNQIMGSGLKDDSISGQKISDKDKNSNFLINTSLSTSPQEEQKENGTAVSIINNSTLGLNVKTDGSDEKTLSNLQKNVTMQVAGMNIKTTAWAVLDITRDNTGIREIVKIPAILYPYLPREFKGKQYVIMDPVTMMDSTDDSISDFKEMIDFQRNFQPQFENFIEKYAEDWNPGFDFITYKGLMRMDTQEGPKYAQTYNLKLTDVTFKPILEYAAQNFIQDKDFISFIKQIMVTSIDLSVDADKETQKKQLEKTFDEIYSHPEEVSNNINTFINIIKDLKIIGDKGIDITYNICDGYIVGESGTVDLNTSISKLVKAINSLSSNREEVTAENIKNILGLEFNFSVESHNINKSVKISFPEITESNSIDYSEFLKLGNSKIKY
ncbi:cell wall-binding repeat-containing protein [Clostridium sp. WILCCON 0269]|uniref:Cell wall-binding repeat-containing protein n=1 Tax=Candidatus Clostridium eludens TaxID=3381663 RepID=A0ABW8SI69_9CLOT